MSATHFIENLRSEIKKEREAIEKRHANAIKDHTNAVNGNSKKGSCKKQHEIDEKKALMDLWKNKLSTAVSQSVQKRFRFIRCTLQFEVQIGRSLVCI